MPGSGPSGSRGDPSPRPRPRFPRPEGSTDAPARPAETPAGAVGVPLERADRPKGSAGAWTGPLASPKDATVSAMAPMGGWKRKSFASQVPDNARDCRLRRVRGGPGARNRPRELGIRGGGRTDRRRPNDVDTTAA